MSDNRHQFSNAGDALAFVLAGDATFTAVSMKSGARYTFQVSKPDNFNPQRPLWFVRVLTGPNNTADYTYIGKIGNDLRFALTAKSKMTSDSAPVKAFDWVLSGLLRNVIVGVEIWHEGKCGRCGLPLTVPESIASGIGPTCASKMQTGRMAA